MNQIQPPIVHPLLPRDRVWARRLITGAWSSPIIVHGQTFHAETLPGFIAWRQEQRLGLLTYYLSGDTCEIITLNSLVEGQGVGTLLIQAVTALSRQAGCTRLLVVTTNDNLDALRFYQKRGFRLVALRPGAMDETRKLKPKVPILGRYGIPLNDELELEISLMDPGEL